MEFVIWLIVGLAVGGAIGAVATWWISRARGGAVSVAELKRENEKFRNEVTEHFVETGRLINQLTDSYKAVFDHLSSGAEKLVDDEALAERLPPSGGEEVRLRHFGAPDSAGAGKSAAKTDDPKSGAAGSSGGKRQGAGNPDPLKSRSGPTDSGPKPGAASRQSPDQASAKPRSRD